MPSCLRCLHSSDVNGHSASWSVFKKEGSTSSCTAAAVSLHGCPFIPTTVFAPAWMPLSELYSAAACSAARQPASIMLRLPVSIINTAHTMSSTADVPAAHHVEVVRRQAVSSVTPAGPRVHSDFTTALYPAGSMAASDSRRTLLFAGSVSNWILINSHCWYT